MTRAIRIPGNPGSIGRHAEDQKGFVIYSSEFTSDLIRLNRAPAMVELISVILLLILTQPFGLHPGDDARPKTGTLPFDHRAWMNSKDQTFSDLSLNDASEADRADFSANEAEAMSRYAALISDPSLTPEQRLETVGSLYQLLVGIWGPETSGKLFSLEV